MSKDGDEEAEMLGQPERMPWWRRLLLMGGLAVASSAGNACAQPADRGGGRGEEAARRTTRPITSESLGSALVVLGSARSLGEEVLNKATGAAVPDLVRRRFRLEAPRAVHGTLPSPEIPLEFEGFTTHPSGRRAAAASLPATTLEGQDVFDTELPGGEFPLLVVVGGPAISPRRGHHGQRAAVTSSGPLAGQPVRAFLLVGPDKELGAAISRLAGLQTDPRSREALLGALEALHPLAGLDALRIASLPPQDGEILPALVGALLAPGKPEALRAAALEETTYALMRAEEGAPEVEPLLAALIASWQAEGSPALEGRYLEAASEATSLLKGSPQAARVRELLKRQTGGEDVERLRAQVRAAIR